MEEYLEKKKWYADGIFGGGWKNAAALGILIVAVFFTSRIYTLLNHGPNALFLKTPLDAAIPLVPVFIIPYISLEPFLYVSLCIFLVFRSKILESAALSMIGAWLVSFAFYILMQSWMERPYISQTGFLYDLIRSVYAADQPYNCFPSLHTSLSTIMAIHWMRFDKRIGIPVSVWTALIVLSTLFVKQHYVADVLSGLALAFGVSFLFLRVIGRRAEPSA